MQKASNSYVRTMVRTAVVWQHLRVRFLAIALACHRATSYPDAMVEIDVESGSIVFGGTASYSGSSSGNPTIVEGPAGDTDAIAFTASTDMLLLSVDGTGGGVQTDSTWTIDTYTQTPLTASNGWHTLTRGEVVGDHHVLIKEVDQVSLGSYDNNEGTGFMDSGYDLSSLDDGWHRLTVSGSSTGVVFYFDGAQVGSHTNPTSADFYAVGNCGCEGQYWGVIHALRIYDDTYTPDELLDLGGTDSPTPAPTIAPTQQPTQLPVPAPTSPAPTSQHEIYNVCCPLPKLNSGVSCNGVSLNTFACAASGLKCTERALPCYA